jgi:hypothetical protein
LPGKTGQVSPQPIVATTSAAWTPSTVRRDVVLDGKPTLREHVHDRRVDAAAGLGAG